VAKKSKLKQAEEQEQRINDLKDRVRILVETPLYLNSDILQNDLYYLG